MCIIKTFVYGTLRRNFSNHRYLEQARFLGNARTQEAYQLRQGIIPYVAEHAEEGRTQIVGEVYAVTKSQLRELDRPEGHPHFYERKQVLVLLDNGERLDAWLYFCERGEGSINYSGDFANTEHAG